MTPATHAVAHRATTHRRAPRRAPAPSALLALGLFAAGMLAPMSACSIIGVIGENYKRTSTRTVKARYDGLTDTSFAVLVHCARSVEADFPRLADSIHERITNALVEHAGATGFVQSVEALRYQYNHPGWAARSPADLAKDLSGVQRLVVVEVFEFRLHDTGNQYIYDGVAAANVAVYEADADAPDQRVLDTMVRVTFPDNQGVARDDLDARVVATTLRNRLTDRASWLFFDHEEPYYPDY